MQLMKRFLLMTQFLTRIPITCRLDIEDNDFVRASGLMPLVALLVGAFMALGIYLGSLTPYRFLPAILAVTLQLLITGVFHLDGLGDTFDGLFSNKDRERMLEIMRDSRIGTNGAAAIFVSILIKLLLLSELTAAFPGTAAMLLTALVPVIGKIGILTAASSSCYARSSGGLGKTLINGIGPREWVEGTLLTALLLLSFAGVGGLLHLVAPLGASWSFTRFVKGRVGGMTGDTLGAANEICEIIYLLFCYNITLFIA